MGAVYHRLDGDAPLGFQAFEAFDACVNDIPGKCFSRHEECAGELICFGFYLAVAPLDFIVREMLVQDQVAEFVGHVEPCACAVFFFGSEECEWPAIDDTGEGIAALVSELNGAEADSRLWPR